MSAKTDQTAIRVENIERRFGEVRAVDDLSFDVARGEILGFLGPNGAGKTTTIRMMTGALRPDAGRVFLGASEVRNGSRAVKRQIGLCPQETVLWERLTCVENLALIGSMYEVDRGTLRTRSAELLELLGLNEKARTRAKHLSGGMKKRLNLAMALVHDPEIVVLDEPITGLDPHSRLRVSETIRDLCREGGKTVVLSTHLMEVAEALSDRIAIVDHGKLLVHDRLEALKSTLGGGDVVELSLEDPKKSEAAVSVVERLNGVEGIAVRDGRIRFQALGAVGMLPELISRLEGVGATIENLSLRPNTLEDVFISLTGRGLRDEQAGT